jgi:hypothetical protein
MQAIEAQNDELVEVKNTLLRGEWIFDSIFPDFRAGLIEGLLRVSENPDHLMRVPTCFLAAAFYRNFPTNLREKVGGKPLPSLPVELVDSDVLWERELWEGAVKELVGQNACLGIAGQKEMTALTEEITKAMPALGSAFEFIPQIVLFKESGWIAASQPHFAGSIFLRQSVLETESLTEIIVHELAHQELFCLNLADRLVNPSADHKYVYAPFQKRDRPTIGRIHAAHSLYRACQFSQVVGDEGTATRMAGFLTKTLETLDSQDFTEFGNFLIEQCYFPLVSHFERNVT